MTEYAPELLNRARQLVWHYGFYSVVNPNMFALKDTWEAEHPELMDDQGRESFRALVLAGRSLLGDETHTCDDSCAGLPKPSSGNKGYRCQHCDRPFDPIGTRYLCPYEDCKVKNTCCEG